MLADPMRPGGKHETEYRASCQSGDTQELACAVQHLAHDEVEPSRISRNAKRVAWEMFDGDLLALKMGADHIEHLHAVISHLGAGLWSDSLGFKLFCNTVEGLQRASDRPG